MSRSMSRALRSPLALVLLLTPMACGGPPGDDLFGHGSGGHSTAGNAQGARAGSAGQSNGSISGGAGVSSGGAAGGQGGSSSGRGGSAGAAGQAGRGGAPVGGAPSSAGTSGAASPNGGTPAAGTAGTPSSPGGSGPSDGGASNGGAAGDGTAGSPACRDDALEVCDGLDNDCDGRTDEENVCPSGCEGHSVEGRGYSFCLGEERTFRRANEACSEQDMDLVWIESPEENAALVESIRAVVADLERIWIGAADPEEGDWHWIDSSGNPHAEFWQGDSAEQGGTQSNDAFVNWGGERPNDWENEESEDCASLTLDRGSLDVGTWNDDECEMALPYVCEAHD